MGCLGRSASLSDHRHSLFKIEPDEDTGFIYWIRPRVSRSNSQGYVGQTERKLCDRLSCHLTPKSGCVGLANSIAYHGRDNFVVQILEAHVPKEQLNDQEVYWIQKLNTWKNGYNCGPGGKTSAMVDEDVRVRHLAACIKSHNTEEYLEGARKRSRAMADRPGESERRSKQAKAQHADPEKKKVHAAGVSNGWKGRKERGNVTSIAEAQKRNWSDPEFRERMKSSRSRGESHKSACKDSYTRMTAEERSGRVKKGWAQLSPEERKARVQKGWETRRARAGKS